MLQLLYIRCLKEMQCEPAASRRRHRPECVTGLKHKSESSLRRDSGTFQYSHDGRRIRCNTETTIAALKNKCISLLLFSSAQTRFFNVVLLFMLLIHVIDLATCTDLCVWLTWNHVIVFKDKWMWYLAFSLNCITPNYNRYRATSSVLTGSASEGSGRANELLTGCPLSFSIGPEQLHPDNLQQINPQHFVNY